ncbi:MAG: ATP-binding protein [Thermoanaerobacterales bacterium]|nr:ATP-binding protein [Thermoanaerobacterales bacterium]
MVDSVTLIPSARRLVQSLRDIGYDLPTAVADLLDNSIEADATMVRVDFSFEGPDSWIRIADNGRGMSPDELDEALRYGTRRPYDEFHLGKFGLGLKTASLSQCRCLTVVTRTKEDPERLEIRRWDIDHIDQADTWEALKLKAADCRPECTAPLTGSTGTVVFWEKLDRILNYKDPLGGWAREGFARLCRDVEEHLAMVFHRFLSGEATRELPLCIFINGNLVEPWDPFARSEPATQSLGPQDLVFHHNGRPLTVTVHPYVLPNEAQFSSSRARAVASGPKRWNRQQGFYIYRANRMIQSGGWNRLRTLDEHTKLARIAIDFSPSADTAFKINVAKMSVQLPDEIKNDLSAIASAVARRADDAYRRLKTPLLRRPGRSKPVVTPGGGHGVFEEPYTYHPDRLQPGVTPESGNRFGLAKPDNTVLPGNKGECYQTGRDLACAVVRVLRHELAGQPELLSRVLTALSELSNEFSVVFNRKDADLL